MKSGLAFIANNVEIVGETPFQLFKDNFLRRASFEEIKDIEDNLRLTLGHSRLLWPVYSSKINIERNEDGSSSATYSDIPPEEWRYWIVAFEGSNSALHQHLLKPLALMDIDMGPTLFYAESSQKGGVNGFGWSAPNLAQCRRVGFARHLPPRTLNISEFMLVPEVIRLASDLKIDHKFIGKALEEFCAVSSLPESSALVVVGYFSIIESLITHKPRLNESLDSITHQIKNKMIFLMKVYLKDGELDNHFGDVDEEKIWASLYSYRSKIAHGDTEDFSGKERQLIGREKVIDFIRGVAKKLIILSLRDPEIIYYLRRC